MYAQPTPNTMSFRRCLLVHVSALVGLATASTASGSAGASSSKGSGAVGFTFLRQFAAPRCRRVLLATRYISCASTGDVDNDDSTNDTPTPVPSIRIQPRHRHLLDQVITNLTQNAYHNIVVVNGAGVSTSCGIPDFRTPGTGLYSKLEEYKLPYPEAIFELDYFRSKPQAFATLAKEIWPGQMEGPKPSRTHAFLRVLQDRGVLRRVYTQNIDGLESLAGVSDETLVECHGHFRSFFCTSCKFTSDDVAECRNSYLSGKPHQCPQCGSLSKPDIVFFGEELPRRFQQLVEDDMNQCDLLIVQGTSLLVNPVAAMPSWVRRNVPRRLLNRELVGDFVQDELMATMFGNDKDDDSYSGRDVFLEGDCDDGVEEICRLVGEDWAEDLSKAHAECFMNMHVDMLRPC